MSSATPECWVMSQLSDVATVTMGQSPESRSYNEEGRGLPFFQGKAEFGRLYPTVRKWCTEPTKIAETGDILLSVRAPVGPTNLAPSQCCIGRGLAAIRAVEPFNQKYLLHYFRCIETWLTQQGTGTTFAAISGDFIRTLEVPVAPLNEQKRISSKIDLLLTRVDSCRARLERVPQILKRFRQAVLAAATTGALTEEWRAEYGLTSDWLPAEVGDIAFVTKLAGFEYTKYVSYREGGDLRVIKAENAGKWGFKYTDFSRVYSEEVSMLTRSKLQEGDVLMVFVGAGTGQVARVPSGDNWFLGPNIAMIRTETKILNPAYLEHYCRSSMGVGEISKFIKSVAQPSLSMKTIRQIQIPLPTIEEQNEIVHRIETLFAFADRIEARYESARAQVDQLTPSLLDKAFRGELVPQDPNDEPAERLLERIKKTQIDQPKAKQRTSTRSIVQRKKITMTKNNVSNLAELVAVLDSLEGEAKPERLIAESGLSGNVDLFFELVREGRDQQILDVPVGSNAPIRRKANAYR